ncbi:chaperone modulator CbpM [Rhodoblastus acidophilus]|uniref:Chaperone modulator CbpM n=1 Tax=Candidatus Rhodoblastus alkanivorans TaxID=2954117 RepID=A0ABS9Z693_9HYPH|nr:MerR family transcriptional regulator [Candidatus Rhodoblastus alkanivorans]MCI4679153.1 chaperone modulator CbpM [Candidatus Rhodoblastus alkanivorans]MCI4683149.1 chaperone modulator CbpM [Candidatus Rhodoblastus alkanivorans]MDI4640460.1 chaperone modulator CbpM [Rhodoblastus acidophilus]
MQSRTFILQARIEAEELEIWCAEGWLLPRETEAGRDFSDVDLARAHFIRDLRNLGVNREGIPIVLDLVDQLHGLRRVTRDLMEAVKALREERPSK